MQVNVCMFALPGRLIIEAAPVFVAPIDISFSVAVGIPYGCPGNQYYTIGVLSGIVGRAATVLGEQ